MAAQLQHWDAEDFHPLHRNQCISAEGRALAEIIDRNEHAMIQASLQNKPALAPLLALLPDGLVAALENDQLMTAFGHMAKLEMEFLGFFQQSEEVRFTNWPFSDRTSELAIFAGRLERGQ